MKKIFAILLAVTMLASMATVVSAAESTTTLSTTVPAASYRPVCHSRQGRGTHRLPFGADHSG